MWNNPNILHESVADVLSDLGVREGQGQTNPANNAPPVLVKEDQQPVSEAEKKKKKSETDETDGEPDTTTTVNVDNTDPVVNNDDTNPEVNVEGEELSREEQIAEAFYDSLDKHIVIVYENDDWDTAEIFGLSEADVAPCGGTPPAITKKYKKAAKEAKTRVDGKGYDALMIHAKKDFGGGKDVIGGQVLQTVGWSAPERGKGRKVASGTKGDGKLTDKGKA